ncbi:hypothetical protein QR680_011735 [Steinernema hermaphroditum]|uniref:Uncharacterized protein n=1 Tax=Steinernema hermaphroditum TaxID=289476 RepID=A0AA39HZJ3_9BILA|nr:hypothetical protein QR680_011735 [Steinernema hermaphroditum]
MSPAERLVALEHYLALTILEVIHVCPGIEGYINKRASEEEPRAFSGVTTTPLEDSIGIRRQAQVDATRLATPPGSRNVEGWTRAILEDLRRWVANPPLIPEQRHEFYQELAQVRGFPASFGWDAQGRRVFEGMSPNAITRPVTEPSYDWEEDDSEGWKQSLEEARRRYARHEVPQLGFDAWVAQEDGAPTRHPQARTPSPRRPRRRPSPPSHRRLTSRTERRPVDRPRRRHSPVTVPSTVSTTHTPTTASPTVSATHVPVEHVTFVVSLSSISASDEFHSADEDAEWLDFKRRVGAK